MNSDNLQASCNKTNNIENIKCLESFIIKTTRNFSRNPGDIKIDDTLNNFTKRLLNKI